MPDLQAYIKHVDLYGPDCILETAAGDLPEKELGELFANLEQCSAPNAGSWPSLDTTAAGGWLSGPPWRLGVSKPPSSKEVTG
jgi:hypothetical protein